MLDDLRPKAVLFDFYGTLVDIETDEHRHGPWDAVAKLLKYRGSNELPDRFREKYFHYVTQALEERAAAGERHPDVDVLPIFERLIAEAGVTVHDGLVVTVAQLFRSYSLTEEIRPFPETHAVMDHLRDRFLLGLVSDSQEPYLRPELRQQRLDEYFRTIVISSRYGYRKPDRRLMEIALDDLGVAPSEAVYVGDSWSRDVEGAVAAGVHPIWVRRKKKEGVPPHRFPVHIIPDLWALKTLGQ